MLNLVLYGFKFVFIVFLYIFVLALIRSVLKDTKLAQVTSVDNIMPARLILNFGKDDSQSFLLTDKINIGRSKAADIFIDNDFVSSNHVQLIKQGNTYLAKDMKSTNGTFINGKRINKETLNDGDILTVGRVDLKFIQ